MIITKKNSNLKFLGVLATVVMGGIFIFFANSRSQAPAILNKVTNPVSTATKEHDNTNLPPQKTLTGGKQMFQTYNNCGPASLAMTLSYYGINETQESLGKQLRPVQNQAGDNDDKAVFMRELARKAEEYGFVAYHRPNGNAQIIKQFINLDIPIIVSTWLDVNDDIGHFRVIKGYDDNKKQFIQDDSYQGKNKVYSYSDFDAIWKKFNYEYLVLIPKDKQVQAEKILGADLDEKIAWANAVKLSNKALEINPFDTAARFNLVVALYRTGVYQKAADEFQKIESQLEKRTLWYQVEPILAYYRLGKYDRVFEITDKILNNGNRSYAELYLLRGMAYEKLGDPKMAEQEFAKAEQYKGKYSSTNIDF